jgi:23S rRNA (adenine-N6)-dimethyltransferase
METRKHKKQFLSQNFLRSSQLARKLVRLSSISGKDTVVEIGAGRGIITAELGRIAKRVFAVEKDPRLARFLRERFYRQRNVEIVHCDFREFRLPHDDFKVFASIPYSVTAEIVRKCLDRRSGMSEAFLIMQREPARKLAGVPRETLVSLLHKPFFEFDIVSKLRRNDFFPVPNVDSVMLSILRRPKPLLTTSEFVQYRQYVQFGFGRWRPHLRSAYKNVFNYKHWKRISREIGIDLDAKPTDLSFDQWLALVRSLVGYRAAAARQRQDALLHTRNT